MAVDTKTYQYGIDDTAITSGNNTTRSLHMTWWWKDFLARTSNTAPWTIEGSSDAVAGGMDAADRWGTTFVEGKLVYANEASPHSWIVLKSPATIGGTFMYILLNMNRGGFWETIDITVSWAPFTGGSDTVSPTTVGPSAFWNDLGIDANSGTGKLHGAIASDGSFWMALARASSFRSLFMLGTMDNLRTGDTDSSAWVYNEHGSGGIATSPLDDVHIITAGGVHTSTTGIIEPYKYDGGASALRSAMGKDQVENKWIKWPVWLWYNDAGIGGDSIKGRIIDAEIPIGTAPQGDTHDLSSTIIGTVVGGLWLPADTTPTLI